MVSSVLDDQSHESPRFQFEALKKRLIATKDRMKDQRREMDEELTSIQELLENRKQWQNFDDPDPVTVPRDIDGCEQMFDKGCATIRRGHADLLKQKLAHVFIGPLPFLLWLIIGGILFAPVWFFVDPAWLKIAAIQTPTSWAMAAGGAAALVSLIFILIMLGMARSKSGPIYLEVQQAYAELKTSHKRWTNCAKKNFPCATAI